MKPLHQRTVAVAILAAGVIIGTRAEAQLAGAAYSTEGSTYSQGFDNLFTTVPANNTTAANTVLPTGWSFVEAGSNANTMLRIDNGSSGTGDTFLYGATGSNERAFGAYASGSLTSQFGGTLTNNTGKALTQFTLTYTGEQWKDGGSSAATPNTDSFAYAIGALTLNATTGYINVTQLDFTALVNNITSDKTLDGNADANRRLITYTVTGIDWQPGTTLTLRWTDPNDPGNDDGLAIDDISFSAIAVPEPATYLAGALAVLGAIGLHRHRLLAGFRGRGIRFTS